MSNWLKIPKTKEEYFSLSIEDRRALPELRQIKIFGEDWMRLQGIDEETINLILIRPPKDGFVTYKMNPDRV